MEEQPERVRLRRERDEELQVEGQETENTFSTIS